jgi:hypothetical protein
VHPDLYRDLARQHRDDLDREAERAGLAAIARREHEGDPLLSQALPQGTRLWARVRLSILARTDRALLAMEGRVARALADPPVPDNTP